MLDMICSNTVDNYFLLTPLAAIFTLVLDEIPLYVCDSSATLFLFLSFSEPQLSFSGPQLLS